MAYPCVPGQRQLLAVLDCPLSFFIANDNIDEMSQGLLPCSRSQGGVAYRSFPRPIDKVDPENVDILCDVVSGAMDVIWNSHSLGLLPTCTLTPYCTSVIHR